MPRNNGWKLGKFGKIHKTRDSKNCVNPKQTEPRNTHQDPTQSNSEKLKRKKNLKSSKRGTPLSLKRKIIQKTVDFWAPLVAQW